MKPASARVTPESGHLRRKKSCPLYPRKRHQVLPIALPHALTVSNAPVIIDLARRYRMPDVYAVAETLAAGGLVSYSVNWDDQVRSVAEYVDRILKGAQASDLAVQNPTRFKLTVNLRAAKAIGLTIPETFLLRADQVIE